MHYIVIPILMGVQVDYVYINILVELFTNDPQGYNLFSRGLYYIAGPPIKRNYFIKNQWIQSAEDRTGSIHHSGWWF